MKKRVFRERYNVVKEAIDKMWGKEIEDSIKRHEEEKKKTTKKTTKKAGK